MNELKLAQREALKFVARERKRKGIKLPSSSGVREAIIPSNPEGIRLQAEYSAALTLAQKTNAKDHWAAVTALENRLRHYQAQRTRDILRPQ